MACHGAIRANQQLSDKEIKGLLDQLDRVISPPTVPTAGPLDQMDPQRP